MLITSKPISGIFERYDSRMGSMAVRVDERWFVSLPNGAGIPCSSREEARNRAEFLNITQEWKTWA